MTNKEKFDKLRFRSYALVGDCCIKTRKTFEYIIYKIGRQMKMTPGGCFSIADWTWEHRRKSGLSSARRSAENFIAEVKRNAYFYAVNLQRHGNEDYDSYLTETEDLAFTMLEDMEIRESDVEGIDEQHRSIDDIIIAIAEGKWKEAASDLVAGEAIIIED